MPVYEYGCGAGHRFEVKQKFSDTPIATCQVCSLPVTKLISASGISFKGSGWYVTDYSNKLKNPEAPAKDSEKASDKSDKSSEKSPEKSQEKSDAPQTSTPATPATSTPSKPESSSSPKSNGGASPSPAPSSPTPSGS